MRSGVVHPACCESIMSNKNCPSSPPEAPAPVCLICTVTRMAALIFSGRKALRQSSGKFNGMSVAHFMQNLFKSLDFLSLEEGSHLFCAICSAQPSPRTLLHVVPSPLGDGWIIPQGARWHAGSDGNSRRRWHFIPFQVGTASSLKKAVSAGRGMNTGTEAHFSLVLFMSAVTCHLLRVFSFMRVCVSLTHFLCKK